MNKRTNARRAARAGANHRGLRHAWRPSLAKARPMAAPELGFGARSCSGASHRRFEENEQPLTCVDSPEDAGLMDSCTLCRGRRGPCIKVAGLCTKNATRRRHHCARKILFFLRSFVAARMVILSHDIALGSSLRATQPLDRSLFIPDTTLSHYSFNQRILGSKREYLTTTHLSTALFFLLEHFFRYAPKPIIDEPKYLYNDIDIFLK
jgi:hypothetical protein